MSDIATPAGHEDPIRERRMVYRVFREWLGLRRLRPFPSINDLNPYAFTSSWDWSFLVSVGVAGGAETRWAPLFEFVGRNFAAEAPACRAGTALDDIPRGTRLAYAAAPIEPVLRDRVPIILQGTVAIDATTRLKLRTTALPFANQDGAVAYAFGSFSGTTAERRETDTPDGLDMLRFVDGTWVKEPLPAGTAGADTRFTVPDDTGTVSGPGKIITAP